MHRHLVATVAALACTALASAADVAGGDGATGMTVADGWLDESRIVASMGTAALGNCFLTSIRISGVEVCTTPIGLPLICIRMRNNYPSNLVEATGRRRHFALQTVSSAAFLKTFAATQTADPTNKKLGKDASDVGGGSGSGRVQARTLALPILVGFLGQLVQGATLQTLCKPIFQAPNLGYYYFADGDETPGQSMWRSIISPYYLNSATSGMSFYAKALETSGLCTIDSNFLVCLGGFGTKYPTSGDIGASSPSLRLITGAWRAQEIGAAPAGTFGPYDVALGPEVHAMLHLPTAMVGMTQSFIPQLPSYQPGSYIQWLYPGIGKPPVGKPDMWCTVLGVGVASSPAIMAQTVSETVTSTWMDEDTLAFGYWTRFTCCNWCTASNESPARHMIPEAGFDPVFTRIP